MAYDLSPLRFWEMDQVDAERWMEALALQNAYRDAIAFVDGEAESFAKAGAT